MTDINPLVEISLLREAKEAIRQNFVVLGMVGLAKFQIANIMREVADEEDPSVTSETKQ